MQTVYGFISDNGDGSCSFHWTRDSELLARLEEDEPDAYWANEGSYSEVLNFPDDLDLIACGFSFYEGN